MTTVRIGALSDITGRSMETLRVLIKTDSAPWGTGGFEDRHHRRFGGQHALAVVLMELLSAQGVDLSVAAQVVRHNELTVERFLDAVERRETPPRSLIADVWTIRHSASRGTFVDRPIQLLSTDDDVVGAVAAALAGIGKDWPSDQESASRQIAGPWLIVASVAEAYRLLQLRADRAGYVVDGRRILSLGDDARSDEGDV